MDMRFFGKKCNGITFFSKKVFPYKLKQLLIILVLILVYMDSNAWAGNSIVLLMDNSGSMQKNDPDSWSRSAAEFFISRCRQTDRVSIIPFDSSLRRNKRLNFVDPVRNQQGIRKFIRGMDYKGPWTDFHWALKAAYQELKDEEGNKFVILFTDGEPDPDPEDKLYRSAPEKKTQLNRKLSIEVIKNLYQPAGIKLFTIAFTSKSDIDFLKILSKEANGTYDFCFRVDQSYGISDIFLRISKFIPVLDNWFSSDIYIPPALAKSFILINLSKDISRRNYINQNILDGINQLEESEHHKKIPLVAYHWPQLSDVRGVKDIVRRLSRIQKFFVILNFTDNGQTAEYFIYDFSSSRKNLRAHNKITLGILPELCGRVANEIFSNLQDYRLRKEITIPVTVKDLVTKKPAVAEVTFLQGEDKFVEYTDAYGHAIFVGYEDEPFTINFASGGVRLGEWSSADYQPEKVFYLAGNYDLVLKVQASPYYYDDLEPQNKKAVIKEEIVAQIELPDLDRKQLTPCVVKNIPIGMVKLNVLKPMYFKEEKISIPPESYLPYSKYINVTPNRVNHENKKLEEIITLDKNYLENIKEWVSMGDISSAEEKAWRLIYLHKDHPQVFRIISCISQAYIEQKDFSKALEILIYFQNKYKDKYYYRTSQELPKDRFLLSLKLAGLRLINYLHNPGEESNNLAKDLGLVDLRVGQRLFNQCQNSMKEELKIESPEAQEFYLCYALAAFHAHRLTEGRLGKEWNRYYLQYKRMKQKSKHEVKLLKIPVLQNLLSEVELADKK